MIVLLGIGSLLAGCVHVSPLISRGKKAGPATNIVYRAQYVEPGSIVIDGRMDPSEPWSPATPCSDFIVAGEDKPARLALKNRMPLKSGTPTGSDV